MTEHQEVYETSQQIADEHVLVLLEIQQDMDDATMRGETHVTLDIEKLATLIAGFQKQIDQLASAALAAMTGLMVDEETKDILKGFLR